MNGLRRNLSQPVAACASTMQRCAWLIAGVVGLAAVSGCAQSEPVAVSEPVERAESSGDGDDVASDVDVTAGTAEESSGQDPIEAEAEVFDGDSVELACLEGVEPGAPLPTAESYGVVFDERGNQLCVGPVSLTASSLESAQINPQVEGTLVDLVFLPGAEGIDRFNALAELCFVRAESCPSGRVAIVLDGDVLLAPTIQVASFERDQIVISGGFGVEKAEEIVDEIRVSILSGTEVLQFRPVIFDLGPGLDP